MARAPATISNDDAEPAGSIVIDDVTLSEGDAGTKLATFTVTRSGGTAAFSVDYATADGTATAGSDYLAASGTLSFADGVNTQTIAVTINGDTLFEPDESFVVDLANPTNGAVLTDGQGTATISNDDVEPPGASIGLFDPGVIASANPFNDGTSVELGMTLRFNQPGEITGIEYYRHPNDANDVDIRDGHLWRASDGALLATATFSSSSGQSGWQTATLNSPVAVQAGENYIVSYRTQNNYVYTYDFFTSANEVSFDGVDDNAFSDSLGIISAPQSDGLTPNGVYRYGSTLVAPTQTYRASNYWVDVLFTPTPDVVGSSISSPLLNEATINDVSLPSGIKPQISLAVAPGNVQEDGNTNIIYTFTRTGETAEPLTVRYIVGGDAVNGMVPGGDPMDYSSIPSSVTFAAGANTATIVVDPTADSTIEPDETVELTLVAGSGYSISNTEPVSATIQNDDDLEVTAPSITSIIDDVAPLTGTVASGGSTNDTVLVLNGTADAGSIVTISDGAILLGTAITDNSGAWSFTTGTLSGGSTYTFSATETDAAGNQSPPSTTYTVTVDTSAPEAPAVLGYTATMINGTTETNATLLLSSSASSPTTFSVTGTATPTGSYSLAIDTITGLATGATYNLFARDAAGNLSPASTQRVVVGSSGNDTFAGVGGSGGDLLVGGGGTADVARYNLEGTGNAEISLTGQLLANSSTAAGSTANIALLNIDVLSGIETLSFTGSGYTGFGARNNQLTGAIQSALQNNSISAFSGNYNSLNGVFTFGSANTNATLVTFDTSSVGSTNYEAFLLLGKTSMAGTSISLTGGNISLIGL